MNHSASEVPGAEPEVILRAIIGFRTDDEGHWVAMLACGHGQHVRHQPPWQTRAWTQTAAGRASMIGTELRCRKCERGEPVEVSGWLGSD